jgi:sugar lactone lactonase YvrE
MCAITSSYEVMTRMAILTAWLILIVLPIILNGQSTPAIQTIAGTGDSGFGGDFGDALSAQLNAPSAVAVDVLRNLYIADTRNNRIRRVDTDRRISTIAGTGSPGFSGDGGPAVAAQLNQPLGVAVDVQGNLYIADTLNQRIRKVDLFGRISTIAGTGSNGFSGDGGPAVQAQLSRVVGLAVDFFGNVYAADVDNNRIRKIDPLGRITTVAGSAAGGFAGDGRRATAAQLNQPRDVAVDGLGQLYIADTSNNRIRRVNLSGIISTVAGNGEAGFSGDGRVATEASLNFPRGVAMDQAGQVYIADMMNNRIRMVNFQGVISTAVGNGEPGFSGDGGPALHASLHFPRDIHVTPNGEIFIADLDNHRVRKVK